MKIAIKFPSRSRPDKFFARLDEISTLIGVDDYQILATLDHDDVSMNKPSVISRMGGYKNLSYTFGTRSTKTWAINRDLDKLGPFDVLLLQSDDMVWQREFGPTILEAFEKYYPDTDGVIHIPDQMAKDKLITYNILGKKYFDRFGYLYYPGYVSVYSDNEFTQVAKMLGRYTYLNGSEGMLIHAHPVWRLSEWDELYRSTEDKAVHKRDREMFERRTNNGFI